ncbi:MAG: hypothetical protein AB1458_15000 [Bacteroidota bacterium]
MKKMRTYFIGSFLNSTEDVFEQARITMLYRLCLFFFFLFMIPLATDIALGYEKAIVLHGIDSLMIIASLFIMRHARKLNHVVNFVFLVIFFSSMLATMMLSPARLEPIAVSWLIFFLAISALLQRGWARVLYCFFFGWLPIVYVIVNKSQEGRLTWPWLVQDGAEDPPLFLMFVPIVLCIYAIWSHTSTISKAQETITQQKSMLEEKNKDITDSIRYARRIQQSLLPTEKYIERAFKRLLRKEE